MASRTVVIFECDMPNCETPEDHVQQWYINKLETVDVCKTHAEQLHAALAPFKAVASRVKYTEPVRRNAPAKRSGTKVDQEQARKDNRNRIASWMADNGYTLPKMGRIPDIVIDAHKENDPNKIPEKYKSPAIVQAPAPAKLTVVPDFQKPDYDTADQKPETPAKKPASPAKKTTTTRKPADK